MEQSSSYDELTIRHQFDRICHLALEGEAVNYYRHMDYRRNHEVFQILTEKKRNVILLSYFMGMSDAEIARKMSLVRTIHEHRIRSLEMLKKVMEESTDEEKSKA